ncbi:GntR family transcriptional regulator [Gephyromycinifex aptenodytis]|uniref:GntR family transcriptional regulator n=1 Tax=Gephyromycinifex aptenodytis TaxID=2716227 RepID=UPI00144599C1|nr:GntR family transcriptional regulator [Gephyromycinifex aptenodytis]
MPNVGSGRDRAYEYLRAELLSEPDLLGTFINEQDVATAVGVSRTPVREALLMLAAQHLVQLVPHRGAFVPTLTGTQAGDVFTAREMIEKWCVREVIANDRAPVEAMRARLEEQRAHVSDAKAFIEADRDFHTLLISAAQNTVLADMYESLRARHVLIGLAAVRHPNARLTDVLDEHGAIVDALAQRDVGAVDAAIEAHLLATRRRLLGS